MMIFNIAVVHLLGMMTPGPDFFYIARTAAVSGRKNAVCAAFGIVVGVMFWASATMLGLALLLKAFPAFNAMLMVLGGGYLMYLGWQMVRVRESAQFQEYRAAAPAAVSSPLNEAKKGLLVNLSNPKVVIYFSSVMSAVLSEIRSGWQIAGVLLLLLAETLAYFSAIALLFSGQTVKRFYSRYSRWLDNFAGLFFLGFGAYLIYRALAV
ncbi:LysE family transporter [Neisseria perflava]|uniref:LysE family transporter n=1 Tax=Neisseria perflava TaxID=33053 RepID=UPI00209DF122|nr:LysE family transporter [Neisseria perflava]MCP1659662.1 RhtB (resistance to homoserine/threonine) family protein [Neisseria perflava]